MHLEDVTQQATRSRLRAYRDVMHARRHVMQIGDVNLWSVENQMSMARLSPQLVHSACPVM